MKIAVCVKAVPEQARRIDPGTKRLDRSGEPTLNPFDANAVEEALRLKGDDGDSEVVLVSLGPARTLDALRKALAMGADRVVLVATPRAAVVPARRPAASRRQRAPRAVVRRRRMSSGSRPKRGTLTGVAAGTCTGAPG